jgi:hypothetical protein
MRRALAAAAALAVAAALMLTVTGTPAAAGAAVKSKAPGLAKAVASAKTTKGRVTAIDKIMAVLRIDVIDPKNGAVVVKGAARSLNDAYLYTSEVEHLALGYAAKDRLTFKTLAAGLDLVWAKLGVHLTGENLGAGVLKVIRADARPSVRDSVALLARLVWQLGLLDKPAQDLAKKIKVSKVRLDPLQAWLIAVEFTFPLIYAHPPPTRASSRLVALTRGLVGHSGAAPSNVCEDLKAVKESLGFSDNMVMSTAEGIVGKMISWPAILQKAGKFVPSLIDIVHGIVTGIGIEITSTIHPDKTELGGPDMFLAVGVVMHLKLPKVVVDCGWLSGDDFPGHGGVPGVYVLWDNGTLTQWGTIRCDGCHKTGPLGTAAETFMPGPEPVHHGMKIIERGDVVAYTAVNISLGNLYGFLGDILRDQGHMIWELSHHKTGYPDGFTADVHVHGKDSSGETTIDLTVTADREKGDDCAKDYGCNYKPTDITGKVTYKSFDPPYTCTGDVPPYKDGLAYLFNIFAETGIIRFGLDFTAKVSKPCDTFGVDLLSKLKPVVDYKNGDIHSTVPIYSGTADITWRY